MAKEKALHIVSLTAENVKRIVAVSITPTGNLVEITGRNMQGKSSVLDVISWTLEGAGAIQKVPLRKGQKSGWGRLDLGDYVVTRKFERTDGEEFTTSLTVENKDGGKLSKGQTLISSFLGDLTMDPVEFLRMKAKDRFDTLKGYVEGVDIEAIDAANRTDFDKRTEVNRQAKAKTAEADAMPIPDATPAAKVDEAALLVELEDVGKHNTDRETRKANRESAAQTIAQHRKDAASRRDSAIDLRAQADSADREADECDQKAAALEERVKQAGELPEPKDTAEIRARLDAAKKTNATIDQATRRTALREDAGKLVTESDAITARMEARLKQKQDAIAAAKMPVEGITFADGDILLNGVPFEQASYAEQLRASVAIAMAGEPRLKVLRIREGSLIDDDGVKLVAEMAQARDWQVWMERVDSTGGRGFVIEDGQVRSVPQAEPAKQETLV